MRFPGFIGPTYSLPSVDADCQRCINLYPELNELGTGKDREIARFVEVPGLNTLLTIGTSGGTRGSYITKGTNQVFHVVKNKLYEIHSDFTKTELGTLNASTGSGPVSMADNGLQLMLVDGGHGYVWDFALLTFTEINDPAFSGSAWVTYQDGTFLFGLPGTNHFGITGLNAVTFDAADISSKEGSPDPIVFGLSDHRNVWLFGSKSIEVFFNSGAALFPFERVEGAFIENGCAAPFSVAPFNGTIAWLGQDKDGRAIVYQASGYTPVRMSTQAMEYEIQKYSTVADARAWTYQDGGHSFYVLNFPTANKTWAFDTQTKMWHERAYLINGQLVRHRAETHVFAFGKHIVGDWENGNIYELSRDYHSDAGAARKWVRRAPHNSSDMVRQFFSEFKLDIETGTGLDGLGQGTDPQIMLRWSSDGGHTWSNERWASMGKIGHTRKRVSWDRLGSSRNRVFEVSGTDPVSIAILGAELMFEAGMT